MNVVAFENPVVRSEACAVGISHSYHHHELSTLQMERSNGPTKSTHDEINLARLLKRLDKATSQPNWFNQQEDKAQQWLNVIDVVQASQFPRATKARSLPR